jgi:1-deoxy-D-xylulose-5-phosphate synthase
MAMTPSNVIKAGPLLNLINSPEDLRRLDVQQLHTVADELRQFIVDQVSVYGGHFGASLGVVELTVALHYAFNTPYDQLVWDVGHQAYGHKILTGRRDQFHTNRLYNGLSGFPKRSESPYDAFGVGHSSTSISAALGMAMASMEKGEKDRQHVAVIGDGALTAGMAFEAMNHAGTTNANLLIVLNDNCMAIDPNVGALKDYLVDITTSKTYNRLKDDIWKMLGHLGPRLGGQAQSIASKIENGIKATLLQHSNLFESLNLRYFGPVDGHDLDHLIQVMKDMKHIPGPKLLHVLTVKGKGFAPAEKDQVKWHAPGKFDKISGEIYKSVPAGPQAPKYQDVFGHTIIELAERNPAIMGITPAMPSGSSLNLMMEKMPERAIDVGIAEQHAVTLSAGMATMGLLPFCNIYSSFMQRAYDQVVHDVCLQKLKVIFFLDRAGIAGADGPTHHGAFDIAYFRCIPNIIVAAPLNEEELRNMMYTAQLPKVKEAMSIRYPRGQGVMPDWRKPFKELEVGKGQCVHKGEAVAILSFGHIGNYVTEARVLLKTDDLNPSHYDMRWAKPLDEALLNDIFTQYKQIITLEDGCLQGGFGSAILEYASDQGYKGSILRLGLPDRFVEHGEQLELHKECGIDPEGIATAVRNLCGVLVKDH